jgi:hypothetical protein
LIPLLANLLRKRNYNRKNSMKKYLLPLLLLPVLAFGHETPSHGPHADGDVEVDINSGVNFTSPPSAAFAYAAQCGTAGGFSTSDFGASASGESQHCKHLRLAAFYEGLYVEAKGRNDNPMAQVWYNQMSGELAVAQELVYSTSLTGAVKETAGDLIIPVALCGGVGVAMTPAAGYFCAVALGIKGVKDTEEATERRAKVVGGLEDRSTNFVEEKPTCAYVNEQLHQYSSACSK